MTDSTDTPKHILFLMSDTGGGHRASMNAIAAALEERYGDAFTWSYVDVYRRMRYPSNKIPDWYPWFVKEAKPLYRLSYRITDSVPMSRLASNITYRANRDRLMAMVDEFPADVVVCVHSLISHPTLSAYLERPTRPPFITVVTDLFTTPHFWYDPRVDLCIVPSQAAYERALSAGLAPEQVTTIGLPVHPAFARGLIPQAQARRDLGWDAHLPAILIVGGSEGMGPLFETARAIDALRLDCQLAIVAGRNSRLEAQLRAQTWNQPTHIYPYIDYMPKLMAASTILVTKAGPSSICEACIAGLPVVLYDAIPGQEDGNVTFVTENGFGVYAPQPQRVAEIVRDWLNEGDAGLQARSERALSFAQPDAAARIAEVVWRYVDHGVQLNTRAARARRLTRR